MTEFEPELEDERFFTGFYRNRRQDEGLTFVKRDIHHPFVEKVYKLLIPMVLSFVPFMCIAAYVESARNSMKESTTLLQIGYPVAFTSFVIMMSFYLRRKKRVGYLLLTLMFISITLICMQIAASSVMLYVFMSILISALCCLGLSVYAFNTKYDFTRIWYYLYVAFIVLLVSSTVADAFIFGEAQSKVRIVSIVFATLLLAMFSFFFVADTQLMLGGRRRYMYYRDEHILAVVHLLIDVLFMTQNILNIFVLPPVYLSSTTLMLYALGA